MAKYYYQLKGKTCGPVPEDELFNLLQAEKIKPDCLVLEKGAKQWIHLNTLSGARERPPQQPPQERTPSAQAASTVPPATVKARSAPRWSVTLPKVALFVLLILIGMVGWLLYSTYPLLPHEHRYDRSTEGNLSRYPMIGESYSLLVKRFQDSIEQDRETPRGRRVWIRSGECDHVVFIVDDQVEAIFMVAASENVGVQHVVDDLLENVPAIATFEPRGENFWWSTSAQAAMAVKSERSILICSELGVAAVQNTSESF